MRRQTSYENGGGLGLAVSGRPGSERVVLLVLSSLLAAALIIIYRLSFVILETNESLQTLEDENEAQRRTISELTSREQPTCPPSPTCPPPPKIKDLKYLKCEAGWEPHGGSCYHFSTNKSSWNESRRSCRDLGGDLVKIDSREEQMFLEARLRGLMKHREDSFWIGLTDSAEEGRWFWVDGSPLDESLSFWMSWEPDDWKEEYEAGEDCVRMGLIEGSYDLKCWFDYFCDTRKRSICEKKADLPKPTKQMR